MRATCGLTMRDAMRPSSTNMARNSASFATLGSIALMATTRDAAPLYTQLGFTSGPGSLKYMEYRDMSSGSETPAA